jgi:hypothetical protein
MPSLRKLTRSYLSLRLLTRRRFGRADDADALYNGSENPSENGSSIFYQNGYDSRAHP